MSQTGRSLYFRVGTLVIVGIAVAVGFILFLTSGRFRGDQLMFETYVRESIAGLDIGAPVRFRGVAVGRVTELGLTAVVYGDAERGVADTTNRLVLIRFSVDPSRYGDAPIEAAVAAGLRARIASQGVTGVSYLEIDFVDPARAPPIAVPWTPTYTYIPSVPSTITQVTTAAERLMTRLADLDIDKLVDGLTGLLTEARRQVSNEGDLGITLNEAARTMVALREAVSDADLAGTVREIREAANRLGSAGQSIDRLASSQDVEGTIASIGQAAADLRTSIARLPAVIQSLEVSLRTVRGTTSDARADLGPLLRDLRATVSSLRDTAEALRRSPSQSLFGAPPPPPRERR